MERAYEEKEVYARIRKESMYIQRIERAYVASIAQVELLRLETERLRQEVEALRAPWKCS